MAKGEGGGGRAGGGDILSGGYSDFGNKWQPSGAAPNGGRHIGRSIGSMSSSSGRKYEITGEILTDKDGNAVARATVRGRILYSRGGLSSSSGFTVNAAKREIAKISKTGFTDRNGIVWKP